MKDIMQRELSSEHSSAERLRALNNVLDECLRKQNVIDVLEAGGGSKTHIVFGHEKKLTITTIDISSVQLDKNAYADHKILGDICKYKFIPESYDVIVCLTSSNTWTILGQRSDPSSTRSDPVGALSSVRRILCRSRVVTKFTPHIAHVLFYRIIHNNPDAGKPGYFPYPTTIKFFISPRNLAKVCKRAGLEVVYLNIYESQVRDMLRRKSQFLGAAFDMVIQALHVGSAGRYISS